MKLEDIRKLCEAAEAEGKDLGCKPRLMRKLLAVAEAAKYHGDKYTDLQKALAALEADE